MKLMLLAAMFMPLLVGYGYYVGDVGFEATVIGLILFTCLIVFLPGAFRAKNYRDREL
jgi:hypothetical protein